MDHTCQFLCSELITVTYEEQPGEIHQATANLEEISTARAVVLLDEQPKLGSSISLAIQGHDLFGVINATIHDDILGYYAVITLDSASQWSRDWFSPNHLFPACECSHEGITATRARTLENRRNTEEIVPANFLALDPKVYHLQ